VIENLLPEGEPRLHGVAGHLHMSSRSLQRRLELEGISFGEIRQHTKLKLARLYLEQSSKSMSDIAYLLGFSSHSSFSRAFSVWTGESPSQARASAQLAACPDEQSRFEASA
jgi:AraC-like DNA-binding protein